MEQRGVYRLGRHIVDVGRRRVFSNGSIIELGWRHFEALRLLVEAGGEIVSKEEFFRQVWQGQFVDESNLTKCIAQLRKSLNNGEGDFVETVPRVGYRLAIPAKLEQPAEESLKIRPRRRWRLWVAGASLAAIAGAGVWFLAKDRQRLVRAETAYEEGRRWRRQYPTGLSTAVENFRLAISLNPNKASYYAALAETLSRIPGTRALDQKLALETAERGVAIDANCAGCNAVLGFLLYSDYWEWERAEKHLLAALRVEPKEEGLRGYYAMLLATQGRLDEALEQANTGIRLDPYHSTLFSIQSGILYFLKRYPEASAAATRALSFGQEQNSAWDWRAYANLMTGNQAAAIEPLAVSGRPWYPNNIDAAFRANGLRGAVEVVLAATDGVPVRAYRRAHWRLALGDRLGALDELEAAHRVHTFDVMYIAVDPMFEPLREEPRFRKILGQMHLGKN